MCAVVAVHRVIERVRVGHGDVIGRIIVDDVVVATHEVEPRDDLVGRERAGLDDVGVVRLVVRGSPDPPKFAWL